MKVEKVWITDKAVHILTSDGREAKERLCDYPRLAHASLESLNSFEFDDFGIYWPELDEDLSFDGFFKVKASVNQLYDLFIRHPELNASAIARRMGFSQSLFAQYISGAKKPSEQRLNAILSEIRSIGRELSEI